MKTLPSPFKFLDAYTLADRTEFFGRDKEIEQLYQLVFKTPLLLVYGASGTGKTSLIQCGLASRFDGTDWLPLWIRREDNVNQALENALHEALPDGFEKDKTISENITQLYQHYLRPVFLIFDQFEELFVLGEKEESDDFIKNITTILDEELPCNIIMVIREEYLGHLYPFEKEIPELFDFRMRVEAMDTARVKEVLTSSFDQFNIEIEAPKEKRLNQIIENVSRGKSGIELPYLQVYLDRLYREDFVRTYPDRTLTKDTQGKWHPVEFTKTEIDEFGTIETVLDKFLDEQIQKIQTDLATRDSEVKQDAVRLLLDAFVSDEGTKKPMRYQRVGNQLQLMVAEENMPRLSPDHLIFCINELEDARLLRSDAHTFELAHDSLAAIIDKRRTNEQRQLNDIRRQIRTMYQNFSKTKEYLTSKQITVFEDFIPSLYLNSDLAQFYQESQKNRATEATEELEKVKKQAEQERKLKEQAEAQKVVAVQNEKRATRRTWMAGFLGGLAVVIAMFSLGQRMEILRNNTELLSKQAELNMALETEERATATAELKREEAEIAKADAKKQALIAVNAKEDAEEKRQEAEAAKDLANREKERTERALGEVKRAQLVTKQALKKANTLVEAFYFYADRFALAYGTKEDGGYNVFYFIDKDGKEVEKLGKWQKAEPFDSRGLATVQEYGTSFLLDTLGNIYEVAYSIETLNANTKALDLSSQKLREVPVTVFDNTQLNILILSDNDLTELLDKIGQLTNLSSLDLRGNNLTKLPGEIGQLTNLSSLDLRGNKLAELHSKIGKLTNLSLLDLRGNNLAELPDKIGLLINLSSLELGGNKLAELPSEIGQLTNLSTLDLEGNKLTMLTSGIGQLTNLSSLDLGRNKLAELPSEIWKLKNLSSLDLGGNNLKGLPVGIGQLNNLSSLYLGRNKLTELPSEIWQLKNLSSLDLGDNNLERLSNEMGQLKKLSLLDLGGNNLEKLPGGIGQLDTLSSLDIGDNNLTELPRKIGKLQNLSLLNLAGNNLEKLPEEMGQLSKLSFIDLAGNNLERLPSEICQLGNLSLLNLGKNKLDELPSKIGQLSNLSSLNLGGNNLTKLPKEIAKLTNLSLLDLTSNPIKEKTIKEIKSWLPSCTVFNDKSD